MDFNKRIQQIKIDEGLKLQRYKCTANKWTIGRGYNLDSNPLGLTAQQINRYSTFGITTEIADDLFNRMVEKIIDNLTNTFGFYESLPDDVRYILVNMTYNLGLGGVLKFKNMLIAIENHDYKRAAKEMVNSAWYKQVGNRAKRLVEIMENVE